MTDYDQLCRAINNLQIKVTYLLKHLGLDNEAAIGQNFHHHHGYRSMETTEPWHLRFAMIRLLTQERSTLQFVKPVNARNAMRPLRTCLQNQKSFN